MILQIKIDNKLGGRKMEKTEHTVIINQYAKLVLTIPEELSIIELNGLALLAKKISNIGDIGIVKRHYTKSGNYPSKTKGTGHRFWSKEMTKELVSRMKAKREKGEAKEIFEELANKFGLTPKQIKHKWANVGIRGY
jgi:hypothetical protein